MVARSDSRGGSKGKLLSSLIVGLFPAFNICLFGPAAIYSSNVEEFDTAFSTLIFPLIGLSVTLAVLLAVVGLVLGKVVRRHYVSLLFATGLLLWAQGAFLIHDYGVLDDRGIDWHEFGPIASFDLALWLGVVLLAIALSARLRSIAVFGSVVFISLQLIPLTPVLLGIDEEGRVPSNSGPPDGIFRYSSDRNIVHLVMDNFQTDVFIELVEEVGYADEFDGFTVYRDNTAAAPHTSMAVPTIFSGRVYDGSVPSSEYYRRATEEGYHAQLLERGYTVNLIPLLSMRDSPRDNYYQIPSLYAGTERDRALRDGARLLDVSLFRQSPHRVRVWIYNRNNWRVSQLVRSHDGFKGIQHRKFLSEYIERLETGGAKPAYHFMHVWPPHPPFTTTESGHSAGEVLASTRENYRNEARPMVALLVDLIRRLKVLGIYDDSLMIFQSDHGGGFEPEFVPRRGLGLMAIKPFGQRGRLRLSDAPSSVTDIAATIMSEAGIEEHDFGGDSILALDARPRTRRFVYFFDDGSLRAIDIVGSAYDPGSYSESRELQTVGGGRKYRYGEFIKAGLAGEGRRFLSKGWKSPAARHVLSDGNVASLTLEVSPPRSDLELVLDVIPIVNEEKHPRQRVGVIVNGRPAGEWILRDRRKQQVRVDIPREWIDGSDLRVDLHLPDAVSPARAGFGGDRRELAIALTGFLISEVDDDSREG